MTTAQLDHTQPGEVPVLPWLRIGQHSFRSRLILGIEQYTSSTLIKAVLEAGGCDVFISTFDLDQSRPSVALYDLDDAVDLDRFIWLGTTSFARSTDEALRTADMLRLSFGIDVLKLDVRTPENAPDNAQTVAAARRLLAEGFAVLPFIRPDLATAAALEDAGCAAIRVMTAPVASGRGVVDPAALSAIVAAVDVPVVAEGGIGAPSHAAYALELGAAAVLVNTAVARASAPHQMAEAMRHATLAGRMAGGMADDPAADATTRPRR